MYIWYLNTMWKGLSNFVSYAMAIARLHVDDMLMLMISALYYINIVSFYSAIGYRRVYTSLHFPLPHLYSETTSICSHCLMLRA